LVLDWWNQWTVRTSGLLWEVPSGAMTKPRFSYDEKCEDLAEYFLVGTTHDPEHVRKLAQTIQDAIEDWMLELERGASPVAGGGEGGE
jgi:hypothetical protein